MSNFKIPALSFVTLHLKKINENLYKKNFSRVGISFKKLYSAAFLVALASVLMIAVLVSINKREQNIVTIPGQVREEQVTVPVQIAIPEEKAPAVQEALSTSRETAGNDSPKKEPEGFRGVQGEIKVNVGWDLHPLYKDWRYHTGIDVLGVKGQVVPAIHSGQVTDVFRDSNSGLTAVVNQKHYQVYYGSLQNVTVEKGSWVQAGQEIGKMGSCEAEPYDHLHLSIKKNDEYIDPLLVINK